jgi:hypothetical protein
MVYIRSFFAINFDADKVLVHEGGCVAVLERLSFHDVAPMARGVADADEYWFVLVDSFLECFGSPFVPIDGVVGMLEEVWAG